jgi:hypothetical protein
VAWVDPELADGVADALTPLELDVPFELVPELPDVAFDDVELLVPVAALLDAEPGRVKATTPAVTSPAAPTETVAARSLARPCRRAATAGRVSSLRLFMGSPSIVASDRMSLASGLVPGLGATSDRPLSVGRERRTRISMIAVPCYPGGQPAYPRAYPHLHDRG